MSDEDSSSDDESTHSESSDEVSLGFTSESSSEASSDEASEGEDEAADNADVPISGSYRSLKQGVIRAGAATDSAKIGNLQEGEVFEALQAVNVDDGQLRVRMARGWVSLTAKSGRPLCVAETSVQQLLSTVPLLQHLEEPVRARIADVLEAEEFQRGHPIVSSGELGSVMYFLEQGAAEAEKDGQTVMTYGPGDFFGELALLKDEPRRATVRATGENGARCLKLGRSAFDEFANGCEALLEQRQQLYGEAEEVDDDSLEDSEEESTLSEDEGSLSVASDGHEELQPEPELEPELEPEPEPEFTAAPIKYMVLTSATGRA
jgi:hypothetical protein